MIPADFLPMPYALSCLLRWRERQLSPRVLIQVASGE